MNLELSKLLLEMKARLDVIAANVFIIAGSVGNDENVDLDAVELVAKSLSYDIAEIAGELEKAEITAHAMEKAAKDAGKGGKP